MLWAMTRKNTEVCKRFIKAGLHADMLKDLSWKSLTVEALVGEPPVKRTLVGLQISILNNVMRRVESARDALRNQPLRAIDVVQNFRGVIKYEHARVRHYQIL